MTIAEIVEIGPMICAVAGVLAALVGAGVGYMTASSLLIEVKDRATSKSEVTSEAALRSFYVRSFVTGTIQLPVGALIVLVLIIVVFMTRRGSLGVFSTLVLICISVYSIYQLSKWVAVAIRLKFRQPTT